MKRENIFAFVALHLSNASAEVAVAEDVKEKMTFDGDLDLNSMERQEFIVVCEEKFHILIPNKDENVFLANVETAVDYIYKKLSA